MIEFLSYRVISNFGIVEMIAWQSASSPTKYSIAKASTQQKKAQQFKTIQKWSGSVIILIASDMDSVKVPSSPSVSPLKFSRLLRDE
mmetsp:Transcript_11088/g.28113  ORF Transcript_11088/g.28113 Transcript_11088/m.28113 type:complete len:87 (-) Transcript_11088:28-288(-)